MLARFGVAVRWPSRVGATLTIREQSSREAVLRHRLLRHQGLQVRRLILGGFRDKLKTRIFQEEDRLPLRLDFFCGLAAQFTSRSFYYDDDNGSCLRSLSGLLDKARFFWGFTAAPLQLQLTRSSSQLLALRQSCFDLQPGSTPVNIGRPLDL